MKQICIKGKPVRGGDFPLICTPIVGRTREQILAELVIVLPKKPDVIEWRVDFFEDIGNTVTVIDVAACIKEAAGKTPIIFTCRSMNEGGERIALNDEDVLKLYVAACASRCIDVIDYELSNPAGNLLRLRSVSRDHDVSMIMSYHNFKFTPAVAEISAKFADAERLGADIAKVAVMPVGAADVLNLLSATLQASGTCKIPLVSMSMGVLGALSRFFGWVYGSAMTFAVGNGSSAPGQVPIEELRAVLASVRRK